jgi:DNA-binding GntR family transcriptional regulator
LDIVDNRTMAVDGSKKRPRHQPVVEALRAAILQGRLAGGERLIEERLSTELETSRGAVREALRRLEHEGLVRSIPYRGAFVLGVTDEEVRRVLIPIRLTLEMFCVEKAMLLLTDDDFAELGKCVWTMEEAARADDLDRIVEADVAFHETVLERARQAYPLHLWRAVAPRIRAYFLRYGQATELATIVEEHRELLAAFQTRDWTVVQPVLEQHIAVETPRPEEVVA